MSYPERILSIQQHIQQLNRSFDNTTEGSPVVDTQTPCKTNFDLEYRKMQHRQKMIDQQRGGQSIVREVKDIQVYMNNYHYRPWNRLDTMTRKDRINHYLKGLRQDLSLTLEEYKQLRNVLMKCLDQNVLTTKTVHYDEEKGELITVPHLKIEEKNNKRVFSYQGPAAPKRTTKRKGPLITSHQNAMKQVLKKYTLDRQQTHISHVNYSSKESDKSSQNHTSQSIII